MLNERHYSRYVFLCINVPCVFCSKRLSSFMPICIYFLEGCTGPFLGNVSNFIPRHRKCSQAECRKAVMYSALYHPTLPITHRTLRIPFESFCGVGIKYLYNDFSCFTAEYPTCPKGLFVYHKIGHVEYSAINHLKPLYNSYVWGNVDVASKIE